jgi:acyl-CoA synthetase (AMP-forming)/AMP-acid ligase II
LVREDCDGNLWFCGRTDNQVKVRGHRVELEEIDLAIEEVRGVERAVTVAVNGGDGLELRVAILAHAEVTVEDIEVQCAVRLPVYMRPSVLRRFDSLPLNANGKVDRRATALLLATKEGR